MNTLELQELLQIRELNERISEILRLLEQEGTTINVTNRGKVIARLVPEQKPEQPVQKDLTEFWKRIDRTAAEIGAHWTEDIDAVEAVRDVRREL